MAGSERRTGMPVPGNHQGYRTEKKGYNDSNRRGACIDDLLPIPPSYITRIDSDPVQAVKERPRGGVEGVPRSSVSLGWSW